MHLKFQIEHKDPFIFTVQYVSMGLEGYLYWEYLYLYKYDNISYTGFKGGNSRHGLTSEAFISVISFFLSAPVV